MATDLEPVIEGLVRWLRTKPGVSEVRQPVLAPRASRPRLPLPMPKSLRGGHDPSFELHFTYKGVPRVFRYFIEQVDEPTTMLNTLRVHTNGELMVRVANDFGQIMSNDIYYANRSVAASVLGKPAPPTGGRR